MKGGNEVRKDGMNVGEGKRRVTLLDEDGDGSQF